VAFQTHLQLVELLLKEFYAVTQKQWILIWYAITRSAGNHFIPDRHGLPHAHTYFAKPMEKNT